MDNCPHSSAFAQDSMFMQRQTGTGIFACNGCLARNI